MTKRPGRSRSSRRPGHRYVLDLYVAGATARSQRAVTNLRRICEEHLGNNAYDLRVIDIYRQLPLARLAQIVAVPTLIRTRPDPPRRLVGDLSDTRRVLLGLELAGDHA